MDTAVSIQGRCMLTGWVQALRSDGGISGPANFRGWAQPWLMGEVLSGGHGKNWMGVVLSGRRGMAEWSCFGCLWARVGRGMDRCAPAPFPLSARKGNRPLQTRMFHVPRAGPPSVP